MERLISNRLLLRPVQMEDAESIYLFGRLENVSKMIGRRVLQSLEHAKEYVAFQIKRNELFSIVLRESNSVIGTIGLRNQNTTQKEFVLRAELHPDYWGQGIAVEACKMIIQMAFKEDQDRIIIGGFYAFNSQSKKVNEKLGFQFKEIKKDDYEHNNTLHDTHVYTMNYTQFLQVSNTW